MLRPQSARGGGIYHAVGFACAVAGPFGAVRSLTVAVLCQEQVEQGWSEGPAGRGRRAQESVSKVLMARCIGTRFAGVSNASRIVDLHGLAHRWRSGTKKRTENGAGNRSQYDFGAI
jgi:hypothetical protein